ncbi:YadA-like family protein [Trinickia sp. YCB016]
MNDFTGEGGVGSMVLNGNGLFLNNKMQINGTLSLNNNKLIDLAAGTADTDGVNVAQLRGVLAGLGGGAGIDADGNILAPSYTIGGTTYNNVGDALKNLDDRVTANTDAINSANSKIDEVDQRVTNVENNNNPYVNVNSSNSPSTANGQSTVSIGGGAQANGNNSTALGENAIANGNNSVALGNGSVADEADTVSVGSSSLQRRITNVDNGQNPTDAVNKRQLDGLRSDMNAAIGTVARAAYSGVAAATALTMIPDVDPGKTLAIGIGTANFKGYQAGALGASARVTPNLKLKVGAGMSAAGTTVGGGASYQW